MLSSSAVLPIATPQARSMYAGSPPAGSWSVLPGAFAREHIAPDASRSLNGGHYPRVCRAVRMVIKRRRDSGEPRVTTIGQSIGRLEDRKLLTGAGEYTADVWPAGAAHVHFVRSPHAHARIASIDVDAARRASGVRAVLTAADANAAGLGKLRFSTSLPGHTVIDPQRPILAGGIVRFVGEAVVCV